MPLVVIPAEAGIQNREGKRGLDCPDFIETMTNK